MKKKKIDESVIVYDDLIPEEEQIRIEEFCTSSIVPWTYLKRSTYGFGENPHIPIQNKDRVKRMADAGWMNNTYEPCQFVHSITDTSKGLPGFNSPGFNHFISVFTAIPVKYIGIARAKINYCHSHPDCPKGAWAPPHIDFANAPGGTKIVLYYINDSDGDTIIFDQNADQFNSLDFKEPLTIRATVSPKRGRFVVFDGSLVHSAGIPRNSASRIVLNINLYKPYSGKSL